MQTMTLLDCHAALHDSLPHFEHCLLPAGTACIAAVALCQAPCCRTNANGDVSTMGMSTQNELKVIGIYLSHDIIVSLRWIRLNPNLHLRRRSYRLHVV